MHHFLRRTHRQAFTLLELILATAVSMIVFGGLYALADGTLQMGGEISLRQDRMLARETFVEWCRTSFRSLPHDSAVILREGEGASDGLPVLDVVGAPDAFVLGSLVRPREAMVSLALRESEAGDIQLGGLFPYLEGEIDTELSERWLVLLRGVTSCQWRVQADGEWASIFDGEERPTFVELELALDGEDPVRHVFWIPPASEPSKSNRAPAGEGNRSGGAAAPSAGVNGGVGAPPSQAPPSPPPNLQR